MQVATSALTSTCAWRIAKVVAFPEYRILLGLCVRDLAVLFLHLLQIVRLAVLGARSVVTESVRIKQQLLSSVVPGNVSPNLRVSDRLVAGLCALFMRPGQSIRSAIVLTPTLLSLHRALTGGNIACCSSPK